MRENWVRGYGNCVFSAVFLEGYSEIIFFFLIQLPLVSFLQGQNKKVIIAYKLIPGKVLMLVLPLFTVYQGFEQ